jgi:hypothetical protein
MRSRLVIAWISIVAAATITIASREVAACSCDLTTLMSPRAGAMDVPVNAVVVLRSVTPSFVLYDLTHDIAVPTTVNPFGDVSEAWIVRPNQPLAPDTMFEMRSGPLQVAIPLRFTTGSTTDDTPPIYDGFASFQAEVTDTSSAPCRNSCWSGNAYRRLRLEYATPPDDAAMLLMEFDRPAGVPAAATVPLFRRYSVSDWPLRLESGGCFPVAPSFAPDEDVCIRLVAFDMAGHRSGDPRQICKKAVACSARYSSACGVLDECAAGSEPSPEGGAGPGEDAGSTTPTVPTEDSQEGGCSLAGGRVARDRAYLFAIAIAGTLLWRRRQRRASRNMTTAQFA